MAIAHVRVRDDVENQLNEKSQRGQNQQQQPTSQKPPGGSPKQVPSLRVLLSQLLNKK